jgi:hypothetical protein
LSAPRSKLSGLFARLRGVKAGLPDLLAIARGLPPVYPRHPKPWVEENRSRIGGGRLFVVSGAKLTRHCFTRASPSSVDGNRRDSSGGRDLFPNVFDRWSNEALHVERFVWFVSERTRPAKDL